MNLERILPVFRDIVFLVGGTFVFINESLNQARWEPMLLGMMFAAGPAAVSAYWSTVRTTGSASSGQSPPLPSSSSPSSSS